MSFEQFLLIAFLVVLPLTQHVVKYLRRQNESPEQAVGRPLPSRRAPEYGEHPPLPRAARRTEPEAMHAHAGTSAENLTASGSALAGTSVARGSDRLDLRRAVVLMTLVGPCRAASPHDWRDPGERA